MIYSRSRPICVSEPRTQRSGVSGLYALSLTPLADSLRARLGPSKHEPNTLPVSFCESVEIADCAD
jgi:hypothetical protein